MIIKIMIMEITIPSRQPRVTRGRALLDVIQGMGSCAVSKRDMPVTAVQGVFATGA